jgi:acyl homoserine lactone synthase
MHDLVAGKLHDLPLEIRHDLGLFRHEVFVRRLGWSLPDIQGAAAVEWDRFDGENTVQIVALDSRRRVCGCARLIPTTGQYLVQDLLPRSLNIDLPCSPTVWELSRFAASVISDDSPSSISPCNGHRGLTRRDAHRRCGNPRYRTTVSPFWP